MTIYFSFLRYNLLMPGARPFVGWENYEFFITNPAFTTALINTLLLVGGVLLITVIGGVLLALLLNLEMWGQGIVRILVIAPFFVSQVALVRFLVLLIVNFFKGLPEYRVLLGQG